MSTRHTLQLRAAVLSHYDEVAKRLGLNPPVMLRKVGLTPRMLASPTQLIPLESALRILDISARESGCDTFGLRMAEARLLSDFGPISLLLTHQSSMRMALASPANVQSAAPTRARNSASVRRSRVPANAYQSGCASVKISE